MKTITISALNIVMPDPHNPQRYIDLLLEAFKNRETVSLKGDFVGEIGECTLDEIKGNKVVKGAFYKFFDLKKEGQWFNIANQMPAEVNDLEKINIPSNLKSHFQAFQFVFIPSCHRLFFITNDQKNSFSPMQAKKMFSNLFKHPNISLNYGQIDITIEPNTETLNRIFSIPRLTSLTIEVTPPNPDDHEDVERELYERMGVIGADKQTIELKSKKLSGLKPDDKIKKLAGVAQSNGRVLGHGVDENGRIINLSTAEHPMLEKTEYNPRTESSFDALILKVSELLKLITKRN